MNNPQLRIPKHLLPAKDQLVYLAISGGVDSVVLLDLLVNAGCRVHLLHVNYHLRGQDSIEDAKQVCKFANMHSVNVSLCDFYMKEHLAKNGGNLQAEARKARYDFFKNHVSKKDILMTAHHLDDQMETFFLHLVRKSGIAGMSCMAEKNGNHWRPLLHFRKADLYQYAKENKLEFREDKSNAENKYLRNRWRNEWIPQMEAACPDLALDITTLIAAFQMERKRLENEYQPLFASIQKTDRWPFDSYDQTDEEGRFLIAKWMGLRPSEIERLQTLRAAGTSKHFRVDRLEAEIWNQGNAFVWKKKQAMNLPTIQMRPVEQLPKAFNKNVLYLDADKIKGALRIRFWCLGDRIAPIGMQGTQLVSDIIKDAGIATTEKTQVCVVEDEENILWCVGLKVSKLAVADASTRKIIEVKL